MTRAAKILVVDDTKHIRNILRFSLTKKGYQVLLVSHGQQALDLVAGPNPPDLIILDIMMPQMDGYEVVRRLKEDRYTAAIPVLFLSAKAQKKDIVRGLEAGGDDYLTKPFDLGDLYRKVATLLARKPAHRNAGAPPAARSTGLTAPPAKPSPLQKLPGRDHSTIMMTDIVGFSRGMEEDEDHTYLKLLKHNEIIRSAITRHHGDEIKTIGDAFLVRFRDPRKAVAAAIEIQERFSAYNRQKDFNERILIRIGLHIGDIMVTDSDVFGTGVNIAARIEALAEPGTICLSRDVYEAVRPALRHRIESMGPQELKNIKDPVSLYRIRLE